MIIRPVKYTDIAQISAIASELASDDKGMNISHIDFSNAKKLIANLTEYDHMLVLETEIPPTEICAVVLLRVDRQIYLRRLAKLEIIVSPKWQGQGMGKVLMQSALDLAEKELMMERVEVEVSTENVGALKLCKSAGFKVEGIAKDWAVSDDGKYLDAYLMAKCKTK